MSENSPVCLILIGEENAVTARMIWETQGRVWTIETLKTKLNGMGKVGVLKKKYAPSRSKSLVSLYYKAR